MKKIWIILCLLVVIAGIVGLLIYVNKAEPFKQDRTLYNYKDKTVDEIRIISGESEVYFVKTKDVWEMVKPKPYSIDPNTVIQLENRLKDFLASRVMDENTEDLQKYGLDKPKASISFKLNDGTENTLLIGEMTASKVQYYSKDSGRKKIYILGSYDVENFLRPVNEFRDRRILCVDPGKINEITLNKADSCEFKVAGDGAGNWTIVKPLKIDARGDAVKEITDDIKEIKIKDFISDSPDDLSKFGLDKPSYALKYKDDKLNEQTIYFGSIDTGKKNIYIMDDKIDEVYSLSLEVFDPRRFKIGDLLNVAPLSVRITDVNKVTIAEDTSTVEFIRDTSQDVFTYGGKTVSMEEFTTFFVDIMALTAEGYDPENKGGIPELTVTLELKDNSKVIKVEFVKRDDLTYYMIINGKPEPFFIGERKVDLIRRWSDRIISNIVQ